MVKQVKVASPTISTINTLQSNNLPVVQLVDPSDQPQTVTATPQSSINATINNIGIQANNLYITGLSGPVTNLNAARLAQLPAGYTSIPYGAQEYINIGAYPNDGTGDPLRVAFDKINNNFSNLFAVTFNTSQAITTGLTPNQVILETPAGTFMQGLFTIRSYDPNNTDMQNVTLSASITNNANNVKFTGYATTFDGNALCRYDMDVSADNVRILVNPIANVEIYHYISYQVTDSGAVTGPAIGLDGYPAGSIMGTEDDLELITEGA